MKQSIITFVLMSFVLFSNCCLFNKSCPQDKSKSDPGYDLLVEKDADGKTFSVKSGEVVAVRLESNPSTGYAWEIVENDSEILTLVDKSFTSHRKAEKMVGVGGTDTFFFKADKKGTANVKFEYHKAFPSEGDTTEYFQFKITVK